MTHERIEINPKMMQGKPVIRGTRITVDSCDFSIVVGLRATGHSVPSERS